VDLLALVHPNSCPFSFNNTLSTELVLAAYLPDYRFAANLNSLALHVTDLILFSISPNADGSIGLTSGKSTCCLSTSNYLVARAARRHKRRSCQGSTSCAGGSKLRLLVSVGGGGRSQNFASLVANADNRSRFVEEILELCSREELDGVDFDWEQPQNQKEMLGYLSLIVETWSAFQQSSLHLIVTVALHPNQFLPNAIFPYVDRIHVMTYDMIAPSSDGMFSHHARFDTAREKLEAFAKKGCPRSKLTLGIPAYGRHAREPNRVMTFSETVVAMQNSDGLGGLPERNELNSFLFDSTVNVREKVKWVAENQFAGIFLWEAGQDVIFEASSSEMGLLQSAADEANFLFSIQNKYEENENSITLAEEF